MEKIKIVAESPTNYPIIPDEIKKQINPYNGASYLHGHLEEWANNDLFEFYGLPDSCLKGTCKWHTASGFYAVNNENKVEYREKPHLNGVYEVEVYGLEVPCIGYFWTTNEREVTLKGTDVKFPIWQQCGLVCMANDGDANAYARAKMAEKADSL